MPVVLIHGVPDTARVWDGLAMRLHGYAPVRLRLPGFGCEVPEGFDCTKEAYAGWIAGQLAAIEGPIDLVAHDWGALLALRVISQQPGRVRSWAVGGAAPDPTYRWHWMARTWQTPLIGELAMLFGFGWVMRAALRGSGLPPEDIDQQVTTWDRRMKDCILPLYRSAKTVGAEWSPDLAAIEAPGLVLWGANDPYSSPALGERLAARTGARLEVLADTGHWWQCQQPTATADALRRFWAGLA